MGHGRMMGDNARMNGARMDGTMMGGGMMDGGAMMMGASPMMDGGPMMNGPMMESMMGKGSGSSRSIMGDGPVAGKRMAARWATAAATLSSESKEALLQALDEEYRAEALYASIVAKLGSRAPYQPITRSDRRHAWILESLAIAHGVELPANAWATAKQPDFTTTKAACRSGAESEKKIVALYDDLLKKDIPADLQRTFEHLRDASAQRHLPPFEACR